MLTIRQYNASDKEAVIHLNTISLQSTNAYIEQKNYYQDLNDIEAIYLNNNGEFLIGFLEKQPVVMGALMKISERRAELKRMRVHPEFQRSGLGESMLKELEKRAKGLGYREIELLTSVRQIGAQHFYVKNGYHEVGRGKNKGPLENIFYEKSLE